MARRHFTPKAARRQDTDLRKSIQHRLLGVPYGFSFVEEQAFLPRTKPRQTNTLTVLCLFLYLQILVGNGYADENRVACIAGWRWWRACCCASLCHLDAAIGAADNS